MHPVIIVQIYNYVKMYHHSYKLPLFLIGTLVRSKFVGTPTGGNCEHSGRTFEFRSNLVGGNSRGGYWSWNCVGPSSNCSSSLSSSNSILIHARSLRSSCHRSSFFLGSCVSSTALCWFINSILYLLLTRGYFTSNLNNIRRNIIFYFFVNVKFINMSFLIELWYQCQLLVYIGRFYLMKAKLLKSI